MNSPELAFIVDRDLFPLCKALRILGFDALSRGDLSAQEAMRRAVEEKRVWIREDLAVVGPHYGIRYFVVQSHQWNEQLTELEAQYHLSSLQQPFSRCLKCNKPVVPITAEEVKDRVPPKIYEAFTDFYYCKRCGRVYWHGSHIERMKRALRNGGWNFL